MTKKQPAAKAKRVPRPDDFETIIGVLACCHTHEDGCRTIETFNNGVGSVDVEVFVQWTQLAAAWVADAPKSKGAR